MQPEPQQSIQSTLTRSSPHTPDAFTHHGPSAEHSSPKPSSHSSERHGESGDSPSEWSLSAPTSELASPTPFALTDTADAAHDKSDDDYVLDHDSSFLDGLKSLKKHQDGDSEDGSLFGDVRQTNIQQFPEGKSRFQTPYCLDDTNSHYQKCCFRSCRTCQHRTF